MLKTLLRDRGIRQAELAKALGVSEPAVSHWNKGRVPAEYVPRIEEITGISRATLRPDLWPADGTPS